ncbi:SURF1 family protein [Nonomuraea pusilla]|uniref:SURF1 family cytochrome oxidase biogenesis protein n=1 Tax=Nonomuraea pusilla TaxID=46177 RepID=UPI0033335EF7
MYRFLLTPRWLALHVVVLLVIPSFVFLGRWQFGRFEERSANSHTVTANLEAPPAPLERLAAPGQPVREDDRFRTVTATGTYDAAHTLLVRRRPQEGRNGFYVLTPLVTGAGQAVIVNRGWVPAGASADAAPQVPAAPTGQVQVTGRLRPSETEESSGIRERPGLPAGQVLLIDAAKIGKAMPYRLVGGYVELVRQDPSPSPAPAPVPEPDVGSGGGLNLAYGVQWWLFIGIAIGGWILLIRREVAERRAAGEPGDDAGNGKNREDGKNGENGQSGKVGEDGKGGQTGAGAGAPREAGSPAN